MFNSQSTIQVGGRWNRNKGRVERPFLGIIAGLVVNGARILELAASKDGRVTTRGDIQLLPPGSLLDRAAPLQRMQQVKLDIHIRIYVCDLKNYLLNEFIINDTLNLIKRQKLKVIK